MRKESSGNTWLHLINHQRCSYWSQGCPSIVNAVVEATFSVEGLGKERKRRRHQQESTPLSIFQAMFCWCMSSTSASSKRYSFAVKWSLRASSSRCMCVSWPLLTVYLCMGYYWLGVSKHSCITQVWDRPIWPQCGGDHLIQVTTEAGSTVCNHK